MAAIAGDFGSLPGGDPAPPGTTGDTTTTTSPVTGTEYPQSGSGWAFQECSTPTGTCTYPLTASWASIVLNEWFLPRQCISWGLTGCQMWRENWRFSWYDAQDTLISSSCSPLYDPGTGLVSVYVCSMWIDGRDRAPGEYRGELCQTVGSSKDCVWPLLTVHFRLAE